MRRTDEPIWRRYLRFLEPDVEADVDDELRFHFSERVDDLVAQGKSVAGARRLAEEEFGDVPAFRRTVVRIDRTVQDRRRRLDRALRFTRGATMDIRFALRTIGRNPGLALVAGLSLALGIAVNVTMFAGLDLAVFHPVDLPAAHQLVRVSSAAVTRGWASAPSSVPDFLAWRDGARSLDLAAYRNTGYNAYLADHAERVEGAEVTAGFFGIHRIPLLAGREFLRSDESTGARVVVIGDRLWRDYSPTTDRSIGSSPSGSSDVFEPARRPVARRPSSLSYRSDSIRSFHGVRPSGT
jgi:hypothetical protein